MIAGQKTPRGALVFAVLASANRDDRHFDRPNVLDITLQDNRHLLLVRECTTAWVRRSRDWKVRLRSAHSSSACRASSSGLRPKSCGGAAE